jgi:hypothetical protein
LLRAAASGCETHRLHEVLHGNHDVFKDVFMRVSVWLELLEESCVWFSRSEYKGKG